MTWTPLWTRVSIRQITCGPVHALPGDPQKVVAMHDWLLANPTLDLAPLELRPKPNGTFRIRDGRHRFLAYVLAERETVSGIVRENPGSRRTTPSYTRYMAALKTKPYASAGRPVVLRLPESQGHAEESIEVAASATSSAQPQASLISPQRCSSTAVERGAKR